MFFRLCLKLDKINLLITDPGTQWLSYCRSYINRFCKISWSKANYKFPEGANRFHALAVVDRVCSIHPPSATMPYETAECAAESHGWKSCWPFTEVQIWDPAMYCSGQLRHCSDRLKPAQASSATAQAADSALTLPPCVTHAWKQKWSLYETRFHVNLSRYHNVAVPLRLVAVYLQPHCLKTISDMVFFGMASQTFVQGL